MPKPEVKEICVQISSLLNFLEYSISFVIWLLIKYNSFLQLFRLNNF